MQNQRTEPKKTDFPKREPSAVELKLAEVWATGADQTECYRQAYGAQGYSPAALRVQACRKFAEPHIQAMLDELRAAGLANARLTLDARIEEERAFAKRCELAGNMGAAGGAYDRINKLLGLYQDRLEVITNQVDTEAELRKLLPADIADQLINEAIGNSSKPN